MQLRNDVITWTVNAELKRDPITQKETVDFEEKFESVLGLSSEDLKVKNDVLAEQVFVFFTSFVNPNIKEAYTWSKRAPIDRDLFASGNLGLYFGLASDRDYLNSKNPHLKYEIALMPGPKGATANFRSTNYAKVYSLSISGRTRNLVLAQKVMEDMLAKEFSNQIVSDYGLAPARQDELYTYIENSETKQVEAVVEQKRVNQDIIYKAAERGDIVMEPLPNLVKNIFEQIVEAFSGSRQTPSEIIRNADQELIRIIQ
jgi:ABC-type glycerol-3-phosphate transport system substrate-binding protein